MLDRIIPSFFKSLLADMCIDHSEVVGISDGFFIVNKSISDILSTRKIFYFPDSSGEKFECSKFFDDWFLYAVPNDVDYTYSLFKLREQEHDAEEGLPADGDTPGVTISFISFKIEILIECLTNPTDKGLTKLNYEINRIVANKGENHHKAIKRYFKNPQSQGSYLIANMYIRHISSFAENNKIVVPDNFKKILQKNLSHKNSRKYSRLPCFIEKLNKEAGRIICDGEYIYLENKEQLCEQEELAILSTHTGNTSFFSFAAEVEYHARFLNQLSKIKIPFFGRSIYDSAIRADMTIGDNEFEGTTPFYKNDSKIVKRQYECHKNFKSIINKNI